MFDRIAHLNDVDRSEVHNFVEPRHAASVLLFRRVLDAPSTYQVLMGKRHQKHSFMPDVFVFPGGAVEKEDYSNQKFPNAIEAKLSAFACQPDPHLGAALVRAAIRETFEETGLVIFGPTGQDERLFSEINWSDAIERFALLSRAITPPGRPKRFDTYFFVLEIDEPDLSGQLTDTKELLDLRWVTYNEACQLKIHNMTRVILEDLNDFMSAPCVNKTDLPGLQPSTIAFYQMVDNFFQMERLEISICP